MAVILGDRGDYLVGRTFGRADLTAASLWAPLAPPPAYPVALLYRRVVLPPAEQAVISDWRDRPSFAWVRDIYAHHRRSCEATSEGSVALYRRLGYRHVPAPRHGPGAGVDGLVFLRKQLVADPAALPGGPRT